MRSLALRCAAAAACWVVVSPFGRASEVWIVDPAGLGHFTSIQRAIDAASDGDVLMVRPGTYVEALTLDGKGVSIVAETSGVVVRGFAPSRVASLGADRDADLVGLRFWPQVSVTALRIESSTGHVRLWDCTLDGTGAFAPPPVLRISGAQEAILVRCDVGGGHGIPDVGEGGAGQDAARVAASVVALYDCALDGGLGGDGLERGICSDGGDGGAALRVDSGSLLFAAGGSFRGGIGGSYAVCGSDGATGYALQVSGDSQALLQLVALTGPTSGAPVLLPGPVRRLECPAWGYERTAVPVDVRGVPGDLVFLANSSQPAFVFLPAALGGFLLVEAPFLASRPAGRVPASGVLHLELELPKLALGNRAARVHLQAFFEPLGGSLVASSPGLVHDLYAAYPN